MEAVHPFIRRLTILFAVHAASMPLPLGWQEVILMGVVDRRASYLGAIVPGLPPACKDAILCEAERKTQSSRSYRKY
eukprot:1320300-Amorphochlora_amoeboformis.AAC.1